VKLTKYSLVI